MSAGAGGRASAGIGVATFAVALALSLTLLLPTRQFNVDHDFVYSSALACGLGESCALVGPWNSIGFHLGPGFVYFLAPLLALSPDPTPAFTVLLCLAAGAAALLAWVASRQWGVVAGVATALVTSASPAATRILMTGLSSALGPLLVTGALLATVTWVRDRRPRDALLAYVCIGLGMQCHSLVALMCLLPPIAGVLVSPRVSLRWPLAGVTLVVFMHTPWLVHYAAVGFPDPRRLQIQGGTGASPDPATSLAYLAAVAGLVGRWHERNAMLSTLAAALAVPLAVILPALLLGAWQPYYALIAYPAIALGVGHCLGASSALPVAKLGKALAVAALAAAVAFTAFHMWTEPPGTPRLVLDAQRELAEQLAGRGLRGVRLAHRVHGDEWDLDGVASVYLERWKLAGAGSAASNPHALVTRRCDELPRDFATARFPLQRARQPTTVALYESRLGAVMATPGGGGDPCSTPWPGPAVHPQIAWGIARSVAPGGRAPQVPTSLWPRRFDGPVMEGVRTQIALRRCSGGPPGELVLRTTYLPGPPRLLVVRGSARGEVRAAIDARPADPRAVSPPLGKGHREWHFELPVAAGAAERVPVQVHVSAGDQGDWVPSDVELYEAPAAHCYSDFAGP